MHRTCVPIRTAVVPRCLVGRPRRLRAPLRRQTVRAAASDSSPPERWNWNPFKEDRSKQDAAEKALREAMSGRKDVLAQFEDSGGDGGNGGDSGDEGWRWSWDDFRNGFFQFGRFLVKWLVGVGRTFKAIFLFAMGIFCISLIIPTLNAVGTFVRVLLRLEKAEDVYGEPEAEPAGMQRSVLFSDDEDETKAKPEAPKPLNERQRRSRERRKMEKRSESGGDQDEKS